MDNQCIITKRAFPGPNASFCNVNFAVRVISPKSFTVKIPVARFRPNYPGVRSADRAGLAGSLECVGWDDAVIIIRTY